MQDLEKAKSILKNESLTCVAVKDDIVFKSSERGVKPLMKWLDDGVLLEGFSVSDKVVGKAAAFLYVLLKVKHVHAFIMSEKSKAVFREFGIEHSFDEIVPAIRNRTNTGFCPMEQAVKDIASPEEARDAIRETVQRLNKK